MLELQGHIVPMAASDAQRHFAGRVRFAGALVDTVLQGRHAAAQRVSTQIDVGDAYVYPGLTDLHSHLGFATLPLWHEPARTSGPWLHRDLWPGAPSYKPAVSWPAYAYLKGAPEALLAYAQVRALAGGTTTIQGWPNANGTPANQLVRSVDDGVDPESIRTSVINLTSAELDDRRALLDEGRALVYHLCEGQRGSKVAREFADVATAGCLRHRLIAIHCCAVGDDEFRQWNVHADLSDRSAPGGVVWSPFSNLWLYDQTTDVVAARAHGVIGLHRLGLGSVGQQEPARRAEGRAHLGPPRRPRRHAVRSRRDGDVESRRPAGPRVARRRARPPGARAHGRRRGDHQASRRSVDQPRAGPRTRHQAGDQRRSRRGTARWP